MANGITTNQHYVPQMYLENFSFGNHMIHAFNKSSRGSMPIGIRNVASERYFYDIPKTLIEDDADTYDVQAVEHFFSEFEGQVSRLLKSIIRKSKLNVLSTSATLGNLAVFTQEERALMSIYLTFQLLRTRDMRNIFLDIMEKGARAYAEEHIGPVTDEIEIRLKKEYHSLSHAQIMFNDARLMKLSDILYKHYWFVGINRSEHPLYTSDNPVASYSHSKSSWMIGGLDSAGIEISFPITSELTLILRDKNYFSQFEQLDNRFVIIPEGNIRHYNELQVLNGFRWIFCRDDKFEVATDVCKHLGADVNKYKGISSKEIKKHLIKFITSRESVKSTGRDG